MRLYNFSLEVHFKRVLGMSFSNMMLLAPRNVVVNGMRCMLKCGAKCMDENYQQTLDKRKS
jgi:hypothetical protein